MGVGRVTRPGLSQKVGEAAINPVPRAMILREAEEAAVSHDYEGGLKVVISVPEGVEIGKKTFNPRLGITGGISILGTSGIVEPMSEKALVESIHVEMKQHFTQGEKYLLVTPGNYGADYLREHMTLPFERNIKCSNYVGETIDMAVDMGVKGILFVAHICLLYTSASSQFFIVQSDSTYLDGQYAAFGHVTEGMDIVDQICKDAKPTDNNGTISADEQPVMTSVTVID